jgi:hypothetical protein
MLGYNGYANNLKNYEEEKLHKAESAKNIRDNINSKNIINDNNIFVEKDDLSQEKVTDDYNYEDELNSDNSNVNSFNVDVEQNIKGENTYLIEQRVSLENYYHNEESAQSVFKVATGKIQESLTTSDKIKLLYISIKLGKDGYEKVEAYLYAEDAEEGVIQALKLLKAELSEKEYDKVRKIAGRFIDMDGAERLY